MILYTCLIPFSCQSRQRKGLFWIVIYLLSQIVWWNIISAVGTFNFLQVRPVLECFLVKRLVYDIGWTSFAHEVRLQIVRLKKVRGCSSPLSVFISSRRFMDPTFNYFTLLSSQRVSGPRPQYFVAWHYKQSLVVCLFRWNLLQFVSLLRLLGMGHKLRSPNRIAVILLGKWSQLLSLGEINIDISSLTRDSS